MWEGLGFKGLGMTCAVTRQAAALCRRVTAAWRRGRVDAVVQSTDKNFMVPVGGVIVAAGPGRPALVQASTEILSEFKI